MRAVIGAVGAGVACALCLIPLAVRAHEPEEAETAPVLVERREPVYPEAARKLGIGGTVSLELTVLRDGSVGEVRVLRPAGFGFDEAAAEAVRQFRFRPARRNGAPVVSTVRFDQQFRIRPYLRAESVAAPASELPPPIDSAAPAQAPAAPRYQSTVISRPPWTAASASTVRNLDFDLRPKTSPNDILRVVPGLLAVQHQGGGKADQLFLRGFDADHGTDVAVFVDGIPINLPSHAHGQGYADLQWIIPETLERIEVVKGPYDVRYGDFATAGAVNLITRTRFDASSVQLTLGGFPSLSGRVEAGERFVAIAAPRLGGRWEPLHPWIALEAARDDGPFIHPEKLKRYSLLGKLSYDLGPATEIGVLFQSYGSGWIGSGQIPAREVEKNPSFRFGSIDPSEGGLTERQMVSAFFRHSEGTQALEASVYFTRYRLQLWNDFTFFLEDPVNASEIEQDDARSVVGARLSYHFHRHLGRVSLRTTLGAEARYDLVHIDRFDAESQNGDFRKRLGRHVDPSELGLSGSNDDLEILNLSGYAEEDAILSRHLRLLAGVRADYFGFSVSDLGETLAAGRPATSGTKQRALVSPKATVVVSPLPERLDLYLNFGMGFHSNQAKVALFDGQTRTVAQEGGTASFVVHAVPRFYGGELGARLSLGRRLDLAGAFWLSYLENETVFDADHATFAPSQPTRRIGVDVEVRAQLQPWLFLDFDLAQASATAVPDTGNGGAIALAPRLYMTGGLSVRNRGGLRAALRLRFLGDRPAFDESSPEYQYFTRRALASGAQNPDYNPARVQAEGYLIFDAYVAYRYRFLEAALSVQNLLNTAWREAQFGNHSCTRDETESPQHPNYAGSGNQLSDGSYVNRCGIAFAGPPSTRSGVTDVHFTPGVPINLQLTLKAYF